LYYIATISISYFNLFIKKKVHLSWSESNKHFILFFHFVYSSFFFYTFSYSRYISRYVCWSRLQKWHVAEYLQPITIRGKSFARSTEHFHSISRFALSNCYKIHRTKCACAANAPPFVRLTRSFAQRRIRTTFTKPTFIWLGGGGLFARTHIHTRARARVHRHAPFFFLHPILWYREYSRVSLHLQSHHCPESWNHLYINLPLFSVITEQCYNIPGYGTYIYPMARVCLHVSRTCVMLHVMH